MALFRVCAGEVAFFCECVLRIWASFRLCAVSLCVCPSLTPCSILSLIIACRADWGVSAHNGASDVFFDQKVTSLFRMYVLCISMIIHLWVEG